MDVCSHLVSNQPGCQAESNAAHRRVCKKDSTISVLKPTKRLTRPWHETKAEHMQNVKSWLFLSSPETLGYIWIRSVCALFATEVDARGSRLYQGLAPRRSLGL